MSLYSCVESVFGLCEASLDVPKMKKYATPARTNSAIITARIAKAFINLFFLSLASLSSGESPSAFADSSPSASAGSLLSVSSVSPPSDSSPLSSAGDSSSVSEASAASSDSEPSASGSAVSGSAAAGSAAVPESVSVTVSTSGLLISSASAGLALSYTAFAREAASAFAERLAFISATLLKMVATFF